MYYQTAKINLLPLWAVRSDRRPFMMDYWVNFATTGTPNGDGLPKWPRFHSSGSAVMYLKGRIPYPDPVPNLPQLQFMDAYFRQLRRAE